MIRIFRNMMVLMGAGFVVCAIGCTATPPLEESLTRIPLPSGHYGGFAWIDSSSVVFSYDISDLQGIPHWRLQVWDIDSNTFSDLPITATYANCFTRRFFAPYLLPDGRLAYFENCNTEQTGAHTVAMAYDFDTQTVEQLIEYEKRGLNFVGSGGWDWKSDMSVAIASDGIGVILSERLQWYYEDTTEYVDIDFGVSYAPSYSADDTRIVFSGSPTKTDSPLFVPEHALYVMSAQPPHDPQLLLRDTDIGDILWLENDEYLMFGGIVGNQSGLHLYSFETRRSHLLLEGAYSTPQLSADGTQIAFMEFLPGQDVRDAIPDEYEMLFLDVDTFIDD